MEHKNAVAKKFGFRNTLKLGDVQFPYQISIRLVVGQQPSALAVCEGVHPHVVRMNQFGQLSQEIRPAPEKVRFLQGVIVFFASA